MGLDRQGALDRVRSDMFPAYRAERVRLDRIDRWHRFDHDTPHAPRQSTREYKELAGRAQTPWLGLVVTAVAQMLYVEGYRGTADPDNAAPWDFWQANGFDKRQIAVHRAALAYGLSYVTVLPGQTMTGAPMPAVRGVSPRRMVTFYADETEDDWPVYALRVDPAKVNGSAGYSIRVYDDTSVHYLTAAADGSGLEWIENREHGIGVCPVVRFSNVIDLEGRTDGEVEPYIPVAGRIDQTTFDRLVVQRFSSWVVRTIAGMAKPEDQTDTQAEKLRLKVEDILVAEDPDTKFGTLAATPLDGFISAHEADVHDLAAVSQTPPHHLLGQMANLSAEALAAAESSLTRKVIERQHSFGEAHEQWLRLAAFVAGDTTSAGDTAAQVRWADMESRSFAQTADALGKLATMLEVPVELLWEKIPGWTEADVQRARTAAPATGEASPEELAAMIQKVYLGVGVVITDAEARALLNRAGAGLEGALPPAAPSPLLAG